MTNPTLSYCHGWSTDCNDKTSWSADGAHEDGNTATLTVDDDDFFNINVSASAGNKSCYYELDMSNVSSTYPKFITTYQTSDSSIKAKVELVFLDATTQTVLDETSSTVWKQVTADIEYPASPNHYVDKIRIYATQATGDVWFNFLLICKDQFTLPHVGPGGVFPDFETKIAEIPIPGREGDVLQHLGMKSPTIVIEGDVHPNETAGSGSGSEWESSTGPHFEYLFDAFHKDVWNWFTCDDPKMSFQVLFKRFELFREVRDGKVVRRYRVTLQLYSRSSLDADRWGGVEWLWVT